MLEVPAGDGFGESPAAGDFGEEFASGGEFDHQVDFGLGRHDFVDFEDVWVVIEAAHGGDLSDYAMFKSGADRFGFVDDFDGNGGVIG